MLSRSPSTPTRDELGDLLFLAHQNKGHVGSAQEVERRGNHDLGPIIFRP